MGLEGTKVGLPEWGYIEKGHTYSEHLALVVWPLHQDRLRIVGGGSPRRSQRLPTRWDGIAWNLHLAPNDIPVVSRTPLFILHTFGTHHDRPSKIAKGQIIVFLDSRILRNKVHGRRMIHCSSLFFLIKLVRTCIGYFLQYHYIPREARMLWILWLTWVTFEATSELVPVFAYYGRIISCATRFHFVEQLPLKISLSVRSRGYPKQKQAHRLQSWIQHLDIFLLSETNHRFTEPIIPFDRV